MSERKGYYLKPAVRATAPTMLFTVVIDTELIESRATPHVTHRRFRSAYLTRCYYRRGGWSPLEEAAFGDPEAALSWIQTRADPQRRNYVVAPTASDALTLLKWWHYASEIGVRWAPRGTRLKELKDTSRDTHKIEISRLCLRGRPDIVDYTHQGCRFVWVSGRQYLPSSEDEIAASVRRAVPDLTWRGADGRDRGASARDRAKLWAHAFRRLCCWWREHSKAPWGLTAGALAMGILRTHTERGSICAHTCPHTHDLERRASWGGRATTFFGGAVGAAPPDSADRVHAPGPDGLGRLSGPAVHLDVRSMYPWLLREQVYPMKLISYRVNPRVTDVVAAARSYGVIAAVLISTDVPEWPHRWRGQVTYPTGTFATVLTGPEIEYLRGRGKILSCTEMALYRRGRPFRAAADALLTMRTAARKEGDSAAELFAKLLSNAMGGKLAQKKGQWQLRPKVAAEQPWGEWRVGDAAGKRVRRYRSMAGLVWEYVRDGGYAGPFAAAFTYLTAYGRLHMARLRDHCPDHSIISQDTDGVWVTPAAVDQLEKRKWKFGDVPGELRVTETAQWGRWYGPRHYVTDLGWVLAGFHEPHVVEGSLVVNDHYTRSPLSASPGAPPEMIASVDRTCDLRREAGSVATDPNGWAVAPVRTHGYSSGHGRG